MTNVRVAVAWILGIALVAAAFTGAYSMYLFKPPVYRCNVDPCSAVCQAEANCKPLWIGPIQIPNPACVGDAVSCDACHTGNVPSQSACDFTFSVISAAQNLAVTASNMASILLGIVFVGLALHWSGSNGKKHK